MTQDASKTFLPLSRSAFRLLALAATIGATTGCDLDVGDAAAQPEADEQRREAPEERAETEEREETEQTGENEDIEETETAPLKAVIGPDGGTLRGEPGSQYAGVKVEIPEGALYEETELKLVKLDEGSYDLPEEAVTCGSTYGFEPNDIELYAPIEVQLPCDHGLVREELRQPDEVEVWAGYEDGWDYVPQLDYGPYTVTIKLEKLAVLTAVYFPPKAEEIVSFKFTPLAQFEPCIAQYPNDPERRPVVEALVVAGEGNDTMYIEGWNIKPGLVFDLFSLERSLLDAEGERVDPFNGFGMAWYQTDLEADSWGNVKQTIRTVLLDEAFGLNGDVELGATKALHAGFWFDDPADAVECGFPADRTTPFNGEQNAGPLAMITVPDAATGQGPLSTETADTEYLEQ